MNKKINKLFDSKNIIMTTIFFSMHFSALLWHIRARIFLKQPRQITGNIEHLCCLYDVIAIFLMNV